MLVGCDGGGGGGEFRPPDSMDFSGGGMEAYQERVGEHETIPVIRFETKPGGDGFVYRIQEQSYNEKEIWEYVRVLLQTTPKLEVHLAPGAFVTPEELATTVQKLRDAGVVHYRVKQPIGSGK